MDASQRKEIGDQVRQARATAMLSQDALAEKAHVAPNTVSAIERGRSVQPGSLAKVMDALHLEPASEVAQREGYPADVHFALELIGMGLMGIPEPERLPVISELVRTLARYGRPVR